MATNPYTNKVIFGNQTVMDLTDDTVEPQNVLQGQTFHDRSGAPQTGTAIGGIPEEELRDTVGWTGKNLIPYDGSNLDYVKSINTNGTWSGNVYTLSPTTFTVNSDGSVTVDGSSNGYNYLELVPLNSFYLEAGSYILGVGLGDIDVLLSYESGGTTQYKTSNSNNPITWTFSERQLVKRIRVQLPPNKSASNVTIYPMLRYSSITDSTYEPYHKSVDEVKYERAEATVLGAKNRFVYPYDNSSYSYANVTITDNGDGTLTVSTTSEGASSFVSYDLHSNMEIPNGNYILTGCPSGGSTSSYYLHTQYKDSGAQTSSYGDDIGNGIEFTANGDRYSADSVKLEVSVHIKSGTIITTPITFKPMLRYASDPDSTYMPYSMTNIELTEIADGLDTRFVTAVTAKGLVYDSVGAEFKNIMPILDSLASQTINGIEIVVNRYTTGQISSIRIKGTATDYTTIELSNDFYIPEGDYILTGCPQGGSASRFYLTVENEGGGSSRATDYGGGDTFTITHIGGQNVRARLIINSGTVISNYTFFYPMIRRSVYGGGYTPYKPSVTQRTVTLSKAEYDALPSVAKNDPYKVYYVYDDESDVGYYELEVTLSSAVASGGTIRIPASGTDSHITTNCTIIPTSELKSDGTPYGYSSVVGSTGYVTITAGEAIPASTKIGVVVYN